MIWSIELYVVLFQSRTKGIISLKITSWFFLSPTLYSRRWVKNVTEMYNPFSFFFPSNKKEGLKKSCIFSWHFGTHQCCPWQVLQPQNKHCISFLQHFFDFFHPWYLLGFNTFYPHFTKRKSVFEILKLFWWSLSLYIFTSCQEVKAF